MKPTIYRIEFPSGATYIGATVRFGNRRKRHLRDGRKGTAVNQRLRAEFALCKHPTITQFASGFDADTLHELEWVVIQQEAPQLNVNLKPHKINMCNVRRIKKPPYSGEATRCCARYGVKYHVYKDRKDRGWNTLQALGLKPPPTQRKPQVRKATMTLQGVTKTYDAWAASISIKKSTLVARKSSGWTDEQILGLEPGRQTNRENTARAEREEQEAKRAARAITYKGVTGPISKVCRHFGVPDSQVRSRLKLGWTLDEAFAIKVKQRNAVLDLEARILRRSLAQTKLTC